MKYIKTYENQVKKPKYKVGEYVYIKKNKHNNGEKYKIRKVTKATIFYFYSLESFDDNICFIDKDLISVEEYEFQQDIKNFNL